jgi:uncharacterized membrane protein
MLLIGIVAGLRALTPLAVVSWAAHLGWIPVQGTWLAFLAATITPYLTTVLALTELVTDKLPTTPSRKVPVAFGTRIVSGALCGGAFAAATGSSLVGLFLGGIGAVIGTFGGAALRGRLAQAFGKDFTAALLEDVVTIAGAIVIVSVLHNTR